MQYLNRHDKNIALALGAMASYLDETIEEQEGRKQTSKIKEVLKQLRTTRTFTYKTLDALMEGLDQAEVEKTIKGLDYMKLLIAYNEKAYKEQQRMDELDSTVSIDREEFLDIVEQAIGVCQTCEKPKKEARECELKDLFLKHDIEPLDPDARGCPYKY